MVKHGLRLDIGSWKIMVISLPMILRRSPTPMVKKVAPVEVHPVGGDHRGPRQKPHDGQHGVRFSQSRFAHHRQHVALVEAERDIVDRPEQAMRRLELDRQVFDFKQGHGIFFKVLRGTSSISGGSSSDSANEGHVARQASESSRCAMIAASLRRARPNSASAR